MWTVRNIESRKNLMSTNNSVAFINFVRNLDTSDDFLILGVSDAIEYIQEHCPHLAIVEEGIYIIEDWEENRMFPDKEFKSFEDGWEYVYEHVDNSEYDQTDNEDDNVYQDIYVIKK